MFASVLLFKVKDMLGKKLWSFILALLSGALNIFTLEIYWILSLIPLNIFVEAVKRYYAMTK
jgi:hypothetical protein